MFVFRSNKSKTTNGGGSDAKKCSGDVEDAEGLALLIPDIQQTSRIVTAASRRLQLKTSLSDYNY